MAKPVSCKKIFNDMMRDGVTYLATPYSSQYPIGSKEDLYIREKRFRNVTFAAGWLFDRGVWVFSTITQGHSISQLRTCQTNAKYWEAYNHKMIELCGSLTVLAEDGWAASVGVSDEIKRAFSIGKQVYKMSVCRNATLSDDEYYVESVGEVYFSRES